LFQFLHIGCRRGYPYAFLLLLSQIAIRAKWKHCPITGLKSGLALSGDWKNADLRSRKAYQMDRERLEKCKLAVIQEGSWGTHVSLTESMIPSITKDAKVQPEIHLGGQRGDT